LGCHLIQGRGQRGATSTRGKGLAWQLVKKNSQLRLPLHLRLRLHVYMIEGVGLGLGGYTLMHRVENKSAD